MLRGRQTDTAIANVSGNITLSGTAVVAGDFAWGDDVYSCTTGWTKNGTALTLPAKPTVALTYGTASVETKSLNWKAYHGNIEGDDEFSVVRLGTEWWSMGLSDAEATTTHSVKHTWATPQNFSQLKTITYGFNWIGYGTKSLDISDITVYINDTQMTILSVTEPDYTVWNRASSPVTTSQVSSIGQIVEIKISLDNLETPSAVTGTEFRAPVWNKIDAEDGFVLLLPTTFKAFKAIGGGEYTYIATVSSGAVEGPISDAQSITVQGDSNIITATITGSGTVRLYRATAGTYGLIGTAESSGTVVIEDTGQSITDILRPTTTLPVGLSTIWGNRVVIASGNTIYVSAAGRPTTFAEVPLNDDGLDGYAVTLGEPINCLNVNEALVAYSPNSKYLFSGATIFKGDRYGQQTPTHSPSIGVVAANGEVELGSDFVVLAGKVEYLPDTFTTSSRVLQRKDIYLLNGNKLYVKKLDVMGWITYTLPFTGVDLEFDGQYAVVSSSGSCLRIANGSTRFTTGYWLSGQMSSIGQLRAKWVMLRGDATVVVTNQTTSSTKLISNDTWNCSLLPSDSFNIKITPSAAVYIATVGYEQTPVRS